MRAALVALLVVVSHSANGLEKLPLQVLLNSVERGEYFLEMTEDGDVLIPPDELREIGIRFDDRTIGKREGLVSLRSLYPALVFKVEESRAELVMTADPDLLQKQTVDLSPKRRLGVLYPRDNSAFLNYSVAAYNLFSAQRFLNAPIELGVHLGPLFFLSDALLIGGRDFGFIRNRSRVIFDFNAPLLRLTVGDFTAASGTLGSVGVLGGVCLLRNFALDPYFSATPKPILTGQLPLPSTLKLYVNDRQTAATLKLSPGTFEIVGPPVSPGANTLRLVIADSEGHVKTIVRPFYQASSLLAQGVNDFSAGVGFKRNDLSLSSFSYETPAGFGYYRAGLTDWLTAGARAEADEERVNGGLNSTIRLGHLGQIGASVGACYDGGEFGYGGEISYSYQSRGFGIGASTRYLSDGYTTVFTPRTEIRPRVQGNLSLGFSHRRLGALSLGGSYNTMWNGDQVGVLTLSHSVRLDGNLNLWTVLTGLLDNGTVRYNGSVGLRLTLGKTVGGIRYNADDTGGRVSAELRKDVNRGTGITYQLRTTESHDWEGNPLFDANASLGYRGRFGDYSAHLRYDQNRNVVGYRFGTEGSLVLIDKSLQLSRPIRDAFALVRVDELPRVAVKYGSREVGVTDGSGRLLLPEFSSLSPNEVSIDAAEVPLDYRMDTTKEYVSPSFRGGAVVKFKPTRFQAVTGKLFLLEGAKRAAAEYAAIELTVGSQTVSSVVGVDGEFYLENVPAGTYHVRLRIDHREGVFELVVPKSKATMIELGEIECRIKAVTVPKPEVSSEPKRPRLVVRVPSPAEWDGESAAAIEEHFAATDLGGKIAIVDAITSHPDPLGGPILVKAVDFLVANLEVLRDEKRVQELAVKASAAIGKILYAPATESMWDLFQRSRSAEVRNSALDSLGIIAKGNSEVSGRLNRWLVSQNLLEETGAAVDQQVIGACVRALGMLEDPSSFSAIFSTMQAGYGETVESEARAALRKVERDFKAQLTNVVVSGGYADRPAALEMAMQEPRFTAAEKGEIAAAALEAALADESSAPGAAESLAAVRLEAVTALGKLDWTPATALLLKSFGRSANGHRTGIASARDLITDVKALAEVGGHDVAVRLSLYLRFLNAMTERGRQPEEALILAVMKALGDLRDTVARATLLASTFLDYPPPVKSVAQAALDRLDGQ